jgi:integrase
LAWALSRLRKRPWSRFRTPRKVAKEHIYLSHEQVHALADGAHDKAPLVLLLAYTGLRWGEAIALRVRDVDLKRRRIKVSQNAVEVGSEIQV